MSGDRMKRKKTTLVVILVILVCILLALSGILAMKIIHVNRQKNADKTDVNPSPNRGPADPTYILEMTNNDPSQSWQGQDRLCQINYYDSNSNQLFAEVLSYYDNDLLCSNTLYSVDRSEDGSLSYAPKYSFLYLYDNQGAMTERIFGALTGSQLYNEATGKLVLDYQYDEDGNPHKLEIDPNRETVVQEKFGVDSSKTEKIYGNASKIPAKNKGYWASVYLNQALLNITPTDKTLCSFIYIDNNEIPELWIDYGYSAAGALIYTQQDGDTDFIQISGSSPQWIEKENKLSITGGRMDVYYQSVYNIQAGKFQVIGKGNYGAENNANVQFDAAGNPIYRYYWNDTEVSKTEYTNRSNQIFEAYKVENGLQSRFTPDQCFRLMEDISA